MRPSFVTYPVCATLRPHWTRFFGGSDGVRTYFILSVVLFLGLTIFGLLNGMFF